MRVVDKINLMAPIDTTICVLITLSVTVLALWILARFIPRIKTLSLSSFIAFIVVVTCLVCWCLDVKVKFLISLFAVILAPGYATASLIVAQVDKIDKIACLSNFEGPFFGITMYFSSFVFYTLVFTMIISRIKKILFP